MSPQPPTTPDKRTRKKRSAGAMPTSYHVADLAGVSQMTVSRAFDDRASIRPETRKRILAAAAEIGYIHNKPAANLTSVRHRAIGVILPTLQDSIYLPMVDGARHTFDKHGAGFLLQAIDYNRNKERGVITSLLAQRVRAVVLPSLGHSADTRRFIEALPVTVVETGNLPEQPLQFAVGHSDFEAGHLATRHLIAIGRRRIAMICGHPSVTSNSRDRLRGYRAALAEAGLPRIPGLVAFTNHTSEGAVAALAAIRATGERFDAVVAAGELWSPPVLLQLIRDGVAVPEEVAVMGVGDARLGRYFPVPLSFVCLPRYETGRIAAELALGASSETSPRTVRLPVDLALRASA